MLTGSAWSLTAKPRLPLQTRCFLKTARLSLMPEKQNTFNQIFFVLVSTTISHLRCCKRQGVNSKDDRLACISGRIAVCVVGR